MHDAVFLHRGYLADDVRLNAFRAAIRQVVRPGDVVADIGAGTGILSFMACEAGASRVYAIERDPIAALGRKIAHANGYDSRVSFIRDDATRVRLPEPVDVVVSDLIGHFAFDSGVFEVLADARARYLKPQGRTIPSRVSLFVAPVEDEDLRAHLRFWTSDPAGVDMSAVYDHARKRAHYATLRPEALLSDPMPVGDYQAAEAGTPHIRTTATVSAIRSGTIDALAGWFAAELAPGIEITNAPHARTRIDRRNLLLPVTPPMRVRASDDVEINLRVLTADHVFQWRIAHRDGAGSVHEFSGSTFEGVLMSREDLDSRRNARP